MGVVWSGLEFRVGRRDKGIAYAEALAAAGVPVEQLQACGHIHSSFTMVDVIATAVGGREKMAQALQRFAGLEEPGVFPSTTLYRGPSIPLACRLMTFCPGAGLRLALQESKGGAWPRSLRAASGYGLRQL
jgi:hypothetical protein